MIESKNFYWINPKTEVKESNIEGKGRYATDLIEKDEIVIIAGGMVLRKKDEGVVGVNITDDYVIGLRPEVDQYQVFKNHSCDPNVYIDGSVIFRALKDIQPGEWILSDYSTFVDSSIIIDKCNCGSKNCRTIIKNTDINLHNLPLSDHMKRKYK